MKFLVPQLLAIAVTPILFGVPVTIAQANEPYTLYRNSPIDITMRIHVATFDTNHGREYNAENCFIAADLWEKEARHPAVRYWCEPGRYRE